MEIQNKYEWQNIFYYQYIIIQCLYFFFKT
jgi:hypothetical protein